MRRLLFVLPLALLLVVPSLSWRTASADDIDESNAARTIKTLLKDDPGENLAQIWKLSESLAAVGRPAIAPLRAAAPTAVPPHRLAISRALLLLQDFTKGLSELREVIADKEAPLTVRVAALHVMGEEGEAEEADWLEEVIDDTHEPMVKLGMAKCLWWLNRANKKKGKEVMLAFMRSTNPDWRAEGALALGEIGATSEAISVLRDLAAQPDERGRSARLLIEVLQLEKVLEARELRTDPPPTDEGPVTPKANGAWPLLDEIRARLREGYVDLSKVEGRQLEDAAAAGLTDALDPHTNYLRPEDNARLLEGLDPSYGGIGAYVYNDPDNGARFTISRPIYGGPVYRADLRSGDIVTAIDGKSTEGLTVEDCVRLLKGPPGTPVIVSIVRRGWSEARPFTLTRARITIPTTAYDMLPGKIGFLQILHFSEDTAAEVGRILDKFEADGVKGLVVDLRYNGGGYLHSGVQIASHFLPGGSVVVTEEGRKGVYPRRVHRSLGSGSQRKQVPMVVLVNQGTASSGEILSGALKDHGRARLVGTMTFGKGSAQIHMPLDSRPGEPFVDAVRKSGRPQAGDTFNDTNGNGKWDRGEPFTAHPRPNGRYDAPEKFVDENGNGVYDAGERFTDANENGIWDAGEKFTDTNGNGKWDPGGALKLTIASYFTPSGFNPKREVKIVDGKPKVVGGIEPDVEAKLVDLDLWEVQAQRKLESSGKVRAYVDQLFADHPLDMPRLARSDRCDPDSYPGFQAFYDSLDTRLDKDAVRWLVRWNVRRKVGDDLGRELVGDLVDDGQIRAGLIDLLSTLKIDPNSIPDLQCLVRDEKKKSDDDDGAEAEK